MSTFRSFRYIYPVMDIACYIINYCNEKGYSISNIKLNLWLYLIKDKYKMCFLEPVVPHGSLFIVKEVYEKFRGWNVSIPTQTEYDEFDEETWRIHHKIISKDDIEEHDRIIINEAIEELQEYCCTDLLKIINNKKTAKKKANPCFKFF